MAPPITTTTTDYDVIIPSSASQTTSVPMVPGDIVPLSTSKETHRAPVTTARTTLTTTSKKPTPVPGRSPGGVHHNVSTPLPPITQSQKGIVDTTSGNGNSTTIIIGVLVPLVVILIAVGVVVYIWYRRKYPVRMVIGRDFATFTNPAYAKRASTLTLMREDGNNPLERLEEIARRNSALTEEDEENADRDGQHNRAFIEEDSTLRNGATKGDGTGVAVESTTATVTIEPPVNIVRERPRKKAVLIKSENLDDIESSFEMVTEASLGQRSESEVSIGNDSTDTRTVSLSSFPETFDQRATKLRTRSENVGWFKSINYIDIEADKHAVTSKARSQSDTTGNLNTSSRILRDRVLIGSSNAFPIHEKLGEHEEEDFVNKEQSADNVGNGLNQSAIRETAVNVSLQAVNNGTNHIQNENIDTEKLKSQTSIEAELSGEESFEILDHSDEMEPPNAVLQEKTADDLNRPIHQTTDIAASSDAHTLENVPANDTQMEDEPSTKKRPSLQLSRESIVLDNIPPTPILVQDSIIFEPETPNPIHLDNTTVSPRKGRRAFTMSDIKVKTSTGSSFDLQRTDERSLSSPEISMVGSYLQESPHDLLDRLSANDDVSKSTTFSLSDTQIESMAQTNTPSRNNNTSADPGESMVPMSQPVEISSLNTVTPLDTMSLNIDNIPSNAEINNASITLPDPSQPEQSANQTGIDNELASDNLLTKDTHVSVEEAITLDMDNRPTADSAIETKPTADNGSARPDVTTPDTSLVTSHLDMDVEPAPTFTNTSQDNGILRSSTPTNATEESIEFISSSETESNEHNESAGENSMPKTKIISPAFKFDIEEADISITDTSTESTESSNSAAGSISFSHIDKSISSDIDILHSGSMFDGSGDHSAQASDGKNDEAKATHMDDSNMSWELLDGDSTPETIASVNVNQATGFQESVLGQFEVGPVADPAVTATGTTSVNLLGDVNIGQEPANLTMSTQPESALVADLSTNGQANLDLSSADTSIDRANMSWDVIAASDDNSEC